MTSTSQWAFIRHSQALIPTLDEMAQHFDNYSDLLQEVRRSGRLTTFDLTLDASEDSLDAFRRRGHWGLYAPTRRPLPVVEPIVPIVVKPKIKPPPPPEPHVYTEDDLAWVEAIAEQLVERAYWHPDAALDRAHREVSGYWRREYARRLDEYNRKWRG